MASFLWGAALKGLGDGATSLGDSAQAYAREERQAPQRVQSEQQLRRDATPRGRIDVSAGSAGEEAMAGQMGMTVPALRRFREANRLDDFSAYESPDATAPGDGVGPSLGQPGLTPTTRKYIADKQRELGEIMQMYMQGDVYGDSARGRAAVRQPGIMAEDRADKLPGSPVVTAEAEGGRAAQAAPPPPAPRPAVSVGAKGVAKGAGGRLTPAATTPDGKKRYVYSLLDGGQR